MGKINIYLDDVRETPDGFVRTFTARETIALLEHIAEDRHDTVDVLSLDHDLGGDDPLIGTGYDVLIWLEEQFFVNNILLPDSIRVHSSNPAAKKRMNAVIDAIYKMRDRRQIDS